MDTDAGHVGGWLQAMRRTSITLATMHHTQTAISSIGCNCYADGVIAERLLQRVRGDSGMGSVNEPMARLAEHVVRIEEKLDQLIAAFAHLAELDDGEDEAMVEVETMDGERYRVPRGSGHL